MTNSKHADVLRILADYPELQGFNSEDFAFDEIFTPNRNGGYKNRKNNLKLKIINAVRDVLEKILEDGEKVMKVARGTAYYPAEIFIGNGFLTMMYNHYAIVGTDQRLLFINVNSRINRPTHYLFQMLYGSIYKVNRGLFGNSLNLYPKKEKRRTFLYVKGTMSKELKELIEAKNKARKPVNNADEAFLSLCPRCFAALKRSLIRCPNCQAHFKEPMKALLRSLLLPGLGDIYLGHRTLGILELIGSVIVWGVVISSILAMGMAGLPVALFLLLFYNGLDGLLTYHMANKGYMLAENP